MHPFRSEEEQARYDTYKAQGGLDKCPLCGIEPLQSFEHWVIAKNNFPFDGISKLHHMIIPKRHIVEKEFLPEEVAELHKIKDEILHKEYEFFIEASTWRKSIPGHFHIHLILTKD